MGVLMKDPTSLPLLAVLAVLAWTAFLAYLSRNPEYPKD